MPRKEGKDLGIDELHKMVGPSIADVQPKAPQLSFFARRSIGMSAQESKQPKHTIIGDPIDEANPTGYGLTAAVARVVRVG